MARLEQLKPKTNVVRLKKPINWSMYLLILNTVLIAGLYIMNIRAR